jgi:hypothetical protein
MKPDQKIMRRHWSLLIAALLGSASYCGGPSLPLAGSTGAAWAQSSQPSVASLIATLSQSPVDTASLAAKLGKVDAATITSLMVTAAAQNAGAAGGFSATVANALVAAAGRNPALAASVGAGMGKAAAVLQAAGFAQAAATIGATIPSSTANAALNTAFTTASVTLPSPAQTVQGNTGSCN